MAYGPLHAIHEYPDPDYAAYVNKYPWREDDYRFPSALPALNGLSSSPLEKISPPRDYGHPRKAGLDNCEIVDRVVQGPARDLTWDPDYQVSEADLT